MPFAHIFIPFVSFLRLNVFMCDVKLLKFLCMIYSNIKRTKNAFVLHVFIFCKKQENCETISGHFQYVNHKYTTSRRKHIWHLENIRNTKNKR